MNADIIVALATAHQNQFSAEFLKYLPENIHVYEAFEREAMKAARRFKHYSARTIIEVLRHHSAVSDESEQPYKINDHFTPSWARLFALRHPGYADLFSFRTTTAMRRAA